MAVTKKNGGTPKPKRYTVTTMSSKSKTGASNSRKVVDKGTGKSTQTTTGSQGGKVFKSTVLKNETPLMKPYVSSRQSIDTTGYSKGKSRFDLITETKSGDRAMTYKGGTRTKQSIPRSKVPSTLTRLTGKKPKK